eukprot:TRINITY_DN11858_c0_g1_i2.p1 TRINITY_DN11858_c0_g1~~TRINITY_DN11858_c0_g1_i2.p1  ORF type:complete len:1540 (+),score=399.62 TRINITY_DN11858_c0_g1_i2:57-4676(+)
MELDSYSQLKQFYAVEQAEPAHVIVVADTDANAARVGQAVAAQFNAELWNTTSLVEAALNDAKVALKNDDARRKNLERQQAREKAKAEAEAAGEEYDDDDDDEDQSSADDSDDGDADELDEDETLDSDQQGFKFTNRPVEEATATAIEALISLRRGEAISEETIQSLLKERLTGERVQSRGYVAAATREECRKWLPLLDKHKLQPQLAFVLHCDPDDVKPSRAADRLHIVTGQMHPKLDMATEWTPPVADDSSEGDMISEGDSDDVQEENTRPTIATLEPFSGFDQVNRQRLVQRPCDANPVREPETAALQRGFGSVASENTVHLSAHQPVHVLVNRILATMRSRQLQPAPEPTPLDNQDTEFSSTSEMLTFLAQLDRDEEDPRTWKISPFGAYCPVTAVRTGDALLGDPECAVVYRGHIYVLANTDCRAAFLRSPRIYLTARMQLPQRVCVVHEQPKDLARALAERVPEDSTPLEVTTLPDLFDGAEAGNAADIAAALEARKHVVLCLRPDELEVFKGVIGSACAPSAIVCPRPAPLPTVTFSDDVDTEAGTEAKPAEVNPQDAQYATRTSQLREQGAAVVTCDHDVLINSDASEVLVEKVRMCLLWQTKARPLQTEHELDLENLSQANLGDTFRYCPVALTEQQVLAPGLPDIAAQFDGAFYHFSSEEAQTKFVAAPHDYLHVDAAPTAPPLRVAMVGPKGAGQTLQARRLAQQHGLVHVNFDAYIGQAGRDPDHRFYSILSDHVAEPEEVPLETEAALDVIRHFWADCPQGVVLQGFPRSEDDIRAMAEAMLFPDIIVNFTLSIEVALRRLLPHQLKLYQQHRARVEYLRAEKARQWQEQLDAHRKAFDEQQEQLRQEWEAERQAARDAGDDVDEDEEFEYEEYEPLEEEEEEDDPEELEDDETARARLENTISSEYEDALDASTAIADACQDELYIPVATIRGDLKPGSQSAILSRTMLKLLQHRNELFERPQVIPLDRCEELLEQGLLRSSRFGTWDPVACSKGLAMQPLAGLRYPVVYRDTVYYFDSPEHRAEFQLTPRRYLAQQAPPTAMPASICVVGKPLAGKTSLAAAVAARLDLDIISSQSALKTATEIDTALARRIRHHMASPNTSLSPALLAACLADSIRRSGTAGYVLDLDVADLELWTCLDSEQIPMPAVVVDISLNLDDVLSRCPKVEENLDSQPTLRTPAVIEQWCASTQAMLGPLRAHCKTEHRNWLTLNGNKSKWALQRMAVAHTVQMTAALGRFYTALHHRRPARLQHSTLPRSHLQAHLSPFGLLDPVAFCQRKEYRSGSLEELEFAVLVGDTVYMMSSQENLKMFCAQPEQFINANPPSTYPQVVPSAQAELVGMQNMELRGYCPVTFEDAYQRYEGLVAGSLHLVAEFAGNYYAFASQQQRDKFLILPSKYCDLQLPARLPPPQVQQLDVTRLPMLGYMEQTVSRLVTKALAASGLARPKHPRLSSKHSAVLYVALYLKAHNPKATAYSKAVWQKKLLAFKQQAGLAAYLAGSMPESVKDEMPIDVDHKLTAFLGAR